MRRLNNADWTYESRHTILEASAEQRVRFRAMVRKSIEEDEGYVPDEVEVENSAAFAWHLRAKDLCAKADLLCEEGVGSEEVMRLLKLGPSLHN